MYDMSDFPNLVLDEMNVPEMPAILLNNIDT